VHVNGAVGHPSLLEGADEFLLGTLEIEAHDRAGQSEPICSNRCTLRGPSFQLRREAAVQNLCITLEPALWYGLLSILLLSTGHANWLQSACALSEPDLYIGRKVSKADGCRAAATALFVEVWRSNKPHIRIRRDCPGTLPIPQ